MSNLRLTPKFLLPIATAAVVVAGSLSSCNKADNSVMNAKIEYADASKAYALASSDFVELSKDSVKYKNRLERLEDARDRYVGNDPVINLVDVEDLKKFNNAIDSAEILVDISTGKVLEKAQLRKNLAEMQLRLAELYEKSKNGVLTIDEKAEYYEKMSFLVKHEIGRASSSTSEMISMHSKILEKIIALKELDEIQKEK